MLAEQPTLFHLHPENLSVLFDHFLMDEKYCNKKAHVLIASSNRITQESLAQQNLAEEHFTPIK